MSLGNRNFDNRNANNLMTGGVGGLGVVGGVQKNWGNTYGLSIPFLESLGITPPLVNKVFVANVSICLCRFNLYFL